MLRVFGQTGSKAFRELVAIDPIGYRGIKVRRHSAGCSAVYTFCTLMAETEMTRIFRIGGKHFPFDGLYNVRVAFGGAPDADSDLTRRKKHDTRGVPNAVSSGRLVLRLARKCPVPEQVCRSSPVACISTAQTVDLTYLVSCQMGLLQAGALPSTAALHHVGSRTLSAAWPDHASSLSPPPHLDYFRKWQSIVEPDAGRRVSAWARLRLHLFALAQALGHRQQLASTERRPQVRTQLGLSCCRLEKADPA